MTILTAPQKYSVQVGTDDTGVPIKEWRQPLIIRSER